MKRLFRLLGEKLTEKRRLRKALRDEQRVCAVLTDQLTEARYEINRLQAAAAPKPVEGKVIPISRAPKRKKSPAAPARRRKRVGN